MVGKHIHQRLLLIYEKEKWIWIQLQLYLQHFFLFKLNDLDHNSGIVFNLVNVDISFYNFLYTWNTPKLTNVKIIYGLLFWVMWEWWILSLTVLCKQLETDKIYEITAFKLCVVGSTGLWWLREGKQRRYTYSCSSFLPTGHFPTTDMGRRSTKRTQLLQWTEEMKIITVQKDWDNWKLENRISQRRELYIKELQKCA